jgi:hypothetical protein
MAVITISRQYGSEGDEIADLVAEKLGLSHLRKENDCPDGLQSGSVGQRDCGFLSRRPKYTACSNAYLADADRPRSHKYEPGRRMPEVCKPNGLGN